jgi:mRNA interferase MazF
VSSTGALAVGDVITVVIPERVPPGHEQEGLRPAVVVGLPDRLGPARFPVVLIVPFSSYKGQPWVEAAPARYPRFEEGTARLRSPSVALLDQVLSVDVRRVRNRRGRLTPEQYGIIESGLTSMFAVSE